MADPISIINLLSTAATLSASVLKYASTVKQASKELKELSVELKKLDGVLGRLVKQVERDEPVEKSKELPSLFDAAAVRHTPLSLLCEPLLSLPLDRTW